MVNWLRLFFVDQLKLITLNKSIETKQVYHNKFSKEIVSDLFKLENQGDALKFKKISWSNQIDLAMFFNSKHTRIDHIYHIDLLKLS